MIHWRDWNGGRISAQEARVLAQKVAEEARALAGNAGERCAMTRVSGDSIFIASKLKGGDAVEVYEARIVRVGEEAKRGPESHDELVARGVEKLMAPVLEDQARRSVDEGSDFMECEACKAKPGSPLICEACLHNRMLVGALRARERKLRAVLAEMAFMVEDALGRRPR